MAFKIDFSQADSNGNVADGTYEAVFYMMNEDTNPNTGNPFIRVDLIIRNDVDQKYQNAHLFDQMYKAKATGKYSMRRLAWMASAAGLDEGREYNSLDELCSDFIGRPVRVTVKNSDENYNGKTYHHVNLTSWQKTKFPNMQHQWKKKPNQVDPFKGNSNGVEVSDDDIPF